MTKIQFKFESQRILAAFGLPKNTGSKIKEVPHEKNADGIELSIEFDIQNSKVVVCLIEPEHWWSFTIEDAERNFLRFARWPDSPEWDLEGDYRRHISIVARAMYCLGFDTVPIGTHFNFPITAHEKLEWQLEFQRRLREETSQVE